MYGINIYYIIHIYIMYINTYNIIYIIYGDIIYISYIIHDIYMHVCVYIYIYIYIYIYTDDGLTVVKNANGPILDKLRKKTIIW